MTKEELIAELHREINRLTQLESETQARWAFVGLYRLSGLIFAYRTVLKWLNQ